MRLVLGRHAERDAGVGELPLHLAELVGARDAKAEIREVVAAVVVEDDAVMPVIHAEIAAISLAVVRDLEADDLRGKPFPVVEPLHADADVPELRDLDHVLLPVLAQRTISMRLGPSVASAPRCSAPVTQLLAIVCLEARHVRPS